MQNVREKLGLILMAIQAIVNNRDWSFFNDFVLSSPVHSGQGEFLKKSIHRENALHPGNGWGKTSVIARKHLFFLLKHFADGKKYKTLNCAITQDQSELVLDEIVHLVENSPVLRGWFIRRVVKHPRPFIEYANYSITEFKTTKKKGESIEGKEYGYISVDEIALEPYLEFIRDKIIFPRLRAWPDSQADYCATPKGFNAWFRVVNSIRSAGGYVRGGSSLENPYIDSDLFNYQIANKPDSYVQQVIYGNFIDNSSMMFASRLDKLFNPDLDFSDVRFGHRYLESWDLARGRKKNNDYTVGFRFDITHSPAQITKVWSFQKPWTDKEKELINLDASTELINSSTESEIRFAHEEAKSIVRLDSTGVGDTLWAMLQDFAIPVDFRGGNKDKLLDHCQACIDSGLVQSPFIPELAEQMTNYQLPDNNLSTDFLMALVIGCSHFKIANKSIIEIIDSKHRRSDLNSIQKFGKKHKHHI